MSMNHRDLFRGIAGLAAATALPAEVAAQDSNPNVASMPLTAYQPRSALWVKETKIERARFPLIDFHTHITWSDGVAGRERITLTAQPDEILPVMDRKNVRLMVDVTGGYGKGLQESIRVLHAPHSDRFLVFTEPWWSKAPEPGYPKFQADEIVSAHQAGARGGQGA
jgi:hypothetical protein